MNWLRNLVFSNSTATEHGTLVVGDDRKSLITQQSGADNKKLEHDEMQPQKRQRKTDEQGIVIYCQEQGSSSNSQLIFQFNWLSNNSPLHQKTKTLKEKMERLFARRNDVQKELDHAEIQLGKKRREEVDHWLTLVNGKIYEILSMINDGQGSSSNSYLSGSIDKFIEEADDLFQRGLFPKGLILSNQESTRLPLLLGKDPVGINFKRNTKQILEWLQNCEHCIIGVYGMGGVGKTTLLQKIHDQLLLHDSSLFGKVYWVTVSHNSSVHKLQEDIAKVLGVEISGVIDEMKRAAILHNRLASMGPTVLILDDMWEWFLGDKVGIPLEGSDCKVILSTRSLEVCRKMGCREFIIKAGLLSDVEAWDLFIDRLGHYDKLEEAAKKLARLIAQECGGLPLAIATMASSMTGAVDIKEWENVLNELKCRRDQDDMNTHVLQILQLSYERLKEENDKNCFLSCVLYGEDVEIRRETLIDMWVNEGLLDEIESRVNQVAKAHAILNKLENWCLLEFGVHCNKVKWVKMHDLVRDMVITITQKHPRFIAKARENLVEVPKEEKWRNDLVKVSLSHNKFKEIPCGMAPMTPNLTVLMLNENFYLKEIPESFFVHMKALSVLDLSRTKIRRVPESVSDLENLRALSLNDCWMLTYVPSLEKLIKLRVLDLKYCYQLEAAPRGLERLKCVEKVGYCPWDISDVCGFNKLIQSSWSSLSCYNFWIRDPALFKVIDQSLIFEVETFSGAYEKGVWIAGWEYREDGSNWLFPNKLEALGILESDMKGRSLGDVLPSLGVVSDEATNLTYVRIDKCRGMISITKVRGTMDLFSHLRELTIRHCGNMKVVFPFEEHPPHLPYLKELCVLECEEVEEIFESNNMATLSQSNPIIVSLPKLESLYLISLPKLGSVYRGLLLSSSQIDVYDIGCVNLKLLRLPKGMIGDKSWSPTMESMLSNTRLWETLHRDYPHQAHLLFHHISQWTSGFDTDDHIYDGTNVDDDNKTKRIIHSDSGDNNDDDDKTKWGASLSLSLLPC